jgi:uncharacterized protein (TIGR02145 family)
MNLRKFILILSAFAVITVSCKDDDDTATKPSLSGDLRISGLPEFVEPGQTCTLTPTGIKHPDGDPVGYYWKISPTETKYDTTDVKVFTFTDTLQTCTIYCCAYADGYSSSSLTTYATVVKGGKDGSITGIEYPEESVDGNNYYTTVGTQTWSFNNVGVGPEGLGYRESDIMSYVLGRYYSYEEAVNVCGKLGSDWKLPSKEDWEILEAYVSDQIATDPTYGKSVAAALLGDAAFNTITMWEYWPTLGTITNSTGMGIIPTGYANLASKTFDGLYSYATFWTSTPAESDENLAYCKYIYCDQPDVFTAKVDKKTFGASVRCIRK